ncbi:MAG: ligase-associated DNA damage response endonuclease PdeM [Candidatus Obscuribacterales bacterium]|nr:ligase-associated DNA damage response endonuclease PdeM [Candidatus Obscuribacterales bacterium]
MANWQKIRRLGETINILPDKAVFLSERKTLLVSDVHLGKGQSFRARQFFAPPGLCAGDLDRLLRLIEGCGASRLIVLGDLVHSRDGIDRELDELFLAFREKTKDVEALLVLGNHDRKVRFSKQWQLTLVNEFFEEDGFIYDHGDSPLPETISTARKFVFSGHIHPAVKLNGTGLSERLPCYWLRQRERRLVLPSFGSFTGAFTIKPESGDRIFIPLYNEGSVVEAKLD